eukprot:5678834-Prymnesium_polylepis.1
MGYRSYVAECPDRPRKIPTVSWRSQYQQSAGGAICGCAVCDFAFGPILDFAFVAGMTIKKASPASSVVKGLDLKCK